MAPRVGPGRAGPASLEIDTNGCALEVCSSGAVADFAFWHVRLSEPNPRLGKMLRRPTKELI